MPEISEDRANELNAAWDAANSTQRLRMPRVSWFAADTVSYFEEKPSKLELAAADRIAKLEDALRRAKQKLVLYRAEHGGEYIGGTEYTNLMEIIDAALGE